MAKTYKPRKWKKAYKPKAKVSAPVKRAISRAIATTREKKLYMIGGSGTLTNHVAHAGYGFISDLGIIPRYEPTSTSTQEGSLGSSRVKDNIILRHFNFELFLHNKSAYNQFIRVVILRNTNMYEQYAANGANLFEDTTGTEVAYSTDYLQGIRLKLNSDLVSKPSDVIFDRTYPLPYDSSQEGGSIPISYIRKINVGRKLMQKITYEYAPDDVSQISPKEGKYIIWFHHIHGQAIVNPSTTSVDYEWRLEQYFEE